MYASLKRKVSSVVISLIIAATLGVASIAFASLTFTSTNISGNGPVVIDGSSTISIGTSTATGVTIGNASNTVSFPGNVNVTGTAAFGSTVSVAGPLTANATATFNGNVAVGNTVLTTNQEVDVVCSGNVTTALQAAITAVDTAGGGVVRLSAGSCYDTAQISRTTGDAIRLTGAGSGANSNGLAIIGATLLDLQYSGGPKIQTTGTGLMEIDHISFKDTVDGTQDFIYTTNTDLNIHDNAFWGLNFTTTAWTLPTQDAIVLAGTTLPTGFNGYGTVIYNNWFSGIRRAVYAQTYANNVDILYNTIWATCGGSAAIESNGYSSTNGGLNVNGNLIESTYYNTPIKLTSTIASNFLGNSFWDQLNGASITAATNANPVVLTSASEIPNGQSITISGATGNWTPINGTFTTTRLSATTFSIPVNSTAFGALTGAPQFSIISSYYYADSASVGNVFVSGWGANIGPLVGGPGAASNTIIDGRSGQSSQFPSLTLPNVVLGNSSANNAYAKILSANSPTYPGNLCLFQYGSAEIDVAQDASALFFAINPSGGNACAHTAAQDLAASPLALSSNQITAYEPILMTTMRSNQQYNTANLPACGAGNILTRAAVSDATSATPGTTYAGGGTYTIWVQCIYNSSGSTYTWIID